MQVANWQPSELLFPSPSACFQIPAFQRPYQWSLGSAHSLIRDTVAAGESPNGREPAPHWIGVMLLGESQFPCALSKTRAGHTCRQVLDGQQRLLTLRLWMLALIDEHIRQTNREPVSPKTFLRDDVLNTQVHSLNQTDWDSIASQSVFSWTSYPEGNDSPLIRNYLYFRYIILRGFEAINSIDEAEIPERTGQGYLLNEWVSEAASPLKPDEIGSLLEACVRLKITILQHEESDGDVERIFETLNSKNTPLGQYDLFRNFILMKGAQSQSKRREIYNSDMRSSEEHVLQLSQLDLRQTRDNLDAFFQDFVCASTGANVSASSSARAFQDWWSDKAEGDAVKFIHEDLVPSAYAWATAITAGQKHSVPTGELLSRVDGSWLEVPTPALRSIWRIENMARRSFVPATMALLSSWAAQGGGRSEAWLTSSIKAIETYVARSILAARPSSPFRGTAIQVAAIAGRGTDQTPRQLKEWFASRIPSDKEVRNAVLQSVELESGQDRPIEDRVARRDLALRVSNSTFCAILDGIACQLEGEENVLPLMLKPSQRMTKKKPLQIEHLFPKSSSQWHPDLEEWGQDLSRMESRLHALGNTTVLPFKVNASVSNRPLKQKQRELQKDGVPKYRVSEDFYAAERWTITEIDARSRRLCDAALRFWPA